MYTENMTEVYDFLFKHVPQVTMSFIGTEDKWSSSLGFHVATTSSNTIETLYDHVSSNDLFYAPWMVKLLNTMYMHSQKKTPTSYGMTSLNE